MIKAVVSFYHPVRGTNFQVQLHKQETMEWEVPYYNFLHTRKGNPIFGKGQKFLSDPVVHV